MDFSLTTMGTASARPVANKYPSAHVLRIHGRLFLIDCGEGTQLQLSRYGFSHVKIDRIFISHLHGDHLFGFFGLVSTMALMGRTAPLYVYAPIGFAGILTFFMEHFGEGVVFEIIHVPLTSLVPRVIYEGKSVEVSAFGLNHRVDAFGFLFREKEPARNIHKWKIKADNLTLAEIGTLKRGEDVIRPDGQMLKVDEYTYIPYKGRSLAYCSDTAPFAELASYIRGVDLLYHEATFAEDLLEMARMTFHSTGSQAASVALEAEVGRLVIGHFSSRYRDLNIILKEAQAIFPATELAQEGMKFDIPLVRYSAE
ncbi:MAG TPA: ribonuclease Z [Bacteroidales bacterium]|jgi:ribonuclease Z|nr:ribonuclease Z [Bacteroidales bacterium]HPB88724.1 ribonuclease Z [Bacteroidales bacterium]HPH53617.1 ribonuclease Z [Bacteroidales bacterium]HPY21305.1 ribonuclease Z [Bacteroidales bacterium]HQA92694.1 ribonuclease Z [Bacteroidales bacterium]